ncbi:MAG: polysaccharide deacetylase family protein [Gemmatimonadota bacterium]|nr:polysaccharide deacetylase family protein [Gemmatimonadota bacterium]
MTDPRPLASVSLDVDNLWSYMKTHGDPGWESRPTYLDRFFPPVLDALDQLGLRITFFCVGVDAEREENLASFQSLTARGHEVGNHSFEHEPWLHLYAPDALVRELERTEQAVERATGQRPIGFRGPGYSWSTALLEILADRGYLYDASTLPTYMGPLARRYYFMTAKLTPPQRRERAQLFGSFADGLRPVKPYHWRLPSGRTLLELPVTTVPVVKVPFHLSYLLYLSRVSEGLMSAYLGAALAACRLTGTEPSFLLHPLDLLGGDQVKELAFFPGMDLPGARKIDLFLRVLRRLGEQFRLVDMSTHARAIIARGGLPLRDADDGRPAHAAGAAPAPRPAA